MKKVLLFTLIIGTSLIIQAQKLAFVCKGSTAKMAESNAIDFPGLQTSVVKNIINNRMFVTSRINTTTDITLGGSANAFGFYGNGRTYLWADNNINSVIFTHRGNVSPGSGYIMIDVSTNGGATWSNNYGPVYSPASSDATARFPQGAIYNPTGNTLASNAYAAYFAPTLDGTNSSWGGLGYGVQKLDLTSAHIQASFNSDATYKCNIPTAFFVSQTGEAWLVDKNFNLATNTFLNSLTIYKGIFNSVTNTYDYTRSTLLCPLTIAGTNLRLADIKIAFAPNGQTGYISLIGHDSYSFMPDSIYYPILYKTTNGGGTWTGPIRVDISAIQAIQDMWPSSAYVYTTGFEHDLAVDANGNPFLTFDISPAPGGWSISTASGYLASAVIYSSDGGSSWDGKILSMLQTFRGTFGVSTDVISSDNRNQISTNMAGTKMFMTWLDTDTLTFGTADGNYYPDIHARALDIATGNMTPVYNVTAGSIADGGAYMGSSSYYVFENTGTYEIPMVYQNMDPTYSTSPVVYHYIKGFTVTDADFSVITSLGEPMENSISVSQNYPNPFSNTTSVVVNLTKSSDLSMSVINLVGQKVVEINKGTVNAGSHTLTIDGSSLKSGIYFYTVKAGENTITHKIIVE